MASIGTLIKGYTPRQMMLLKFIDYITKYYNSPNEVFLKSFKNKYWEESLPPSNMAIEILTFGRLSKLFSYLKNDEEKQNISKYFKLPGNILSSWFTHLTIIRNICAHHSRLWNINISAERPIIPKRKEFKFNGVLPENFNTTIYGILAIINRLLSAIIPDNSFIQQFYKLMKDSPEINIKLMGFPDNWKDNPPW